MHPDAAKEFVRLHDLIEAGRLPDFMPRLFSVGHELLHGYHNSIRQYKCIKCEHEWAAKDSDTVNQCPNCKVMEEGKQHWEDFIFDVTKEWVKRWRCKKCKHEWDAEDGTICPECKACTKNGVLVE